MMNFDILIANGRIVDGTGNPWYRGDVGIAGGRIVAVRRLEGATAERIIDASGLVVCPGFIDVHCHSDVMLLGEPRHEPKVRQGVTTDIIGQDGLSYAPASPQALTFWREYLAGVNGDPAIAWDWSSVGEFLAQFDGKVAVNVAYCLPHGNIRYEVLGLANRQATPEEITAMQRLVAQGMEEGAVGFSTGLGMYIPGCYANTEELIALCRVVAQYDGVYATHLRNYGERIAEAVAEAFTIGEEAGVPVHVAHFNGRSAQLLPLVEAGRRRGLDVTYDSYPYLAGCTLLAACLPVWSQEGGVQTTVDRLGQREVRERLCQEMESGAIDWTLNVMAAVRSQANKPYEGLNLVQGAERAGKGLTDFICDLLIAERLAVAVVTHHTTRTEQDVREIMRHRAHMVASDGVLTGGKPHPRGYGTYPRYLGCYVRAFGVLELEECVRKMTSLPATRFGLKGRGLLKEDFAADVVVFNPDTVLDTATYEEGRSFPLGIPYVLVNGQVVIDDGCHTGALPGRVLRRERVWQVA